MKRHFKKIIFSLIFLSGFLVCQNVQAACTGSSPTWYCTTDSCPTQAEVQACINGATSGDTINIAAGSYSWTGGVSIPEAKTIKLIGAGSSISGTVITGTGSALNTFVNFKSDNTRISGFRFLNSGSSNNGSPAKMIYAQGQNWRIDHNYLEDIYDYETQASWEFCVAADASNLAAYRIPTGVVDNNTLMHCKAFVAGRSYNLTGNTDNGFWALPSALGEKENVYFEDNIMDRGTPVSVITDANYAGHYVLRYNTVNMPDTDMMTHSIQGPAHRATKEWEIYGNYITGNPSQLVFFRGGTGNIFYNYANLGVASSTLFLDNVRSANGLTSNNSYNATPDFTNDAGLCNGASTWDGNTAISASVYGDSGSGTAKTGSTSTSLFDSAKSWTADSLASTLYTGSNTGSQSSTTVTDSTKSFSTSSRPTGLLLRNITDNSWCRTTSNTSTSLTCSEGLQGGTHNYFAANDEYAVYWYATVYNETTEQSAYIYANTETTITHTPITSGWTAGDLYKVTDGYPCRDQIGRGPDSTMWTVGAAYAQTNLPAYFWANINGYNSSLISASVRSGTKTIQLDRDYYDYDLSFDGTSGIGCGTLANRPASASKAGVGYWATDQSCSSLTNYVGDINTYPSRQTISGTLYTWDGAQWNVAYTPATYPDVRRTDCVNYPTTCDGAADTTAPASPTGLEVS